MAYILFLYAAMGLVRTATDQRLETIPLTTPLDLDEQKQMESAIGERIVQRSSSGHLPRLLIRRDPQIHDRASSWLREHGRYQ